VEKADLSKGYQKIGGNPHFSEIIEQIWKEIAINSLYFNAFLELWLLYYL